MSKSKEKRIKKLKKNHIWPSIVGLSLILLIFTLILTAVLTMTVMDIVERKLLDSSEKSLKIAELFEGYNPETETEIRQKALSYIDILDAIETVAVTDTEGNPVWSSNDGYPVIENAVGFEIFTNEEIKQYRIIIDEDNKHLFVVEDGELVIDSTVFFDIFGSRFDIEATFTNVKVWFVIPVNGMNVMVLNDIHVYYRDLIMMLSCTVLCGVLIVIFVIYYLVSIISMAVGAHRTTKIIYTDMLTGGDNWLLFIKKATSLLKKNKRGSLNYAMLHLEMRKYRSFCTCFGVSKGQELVEKFHAVLKREMYRKEAMAHQEDEAFGLLVTYTDTAQLEARIQKIENALNAVLPGMKMYFGVGVYLVQPGENDVEQLYNNAMIACEMIGDEAENRTAYFDVEMNNQKLWERKVEDDMERALAISGGADFLQSPTRVDIKQLYIKESLLLRQSLSLCQSLLNREERLKAAYFEAVRTLLTRVEGKGKISLKEINERINELLKQSIKSDGVINLFSDVNEEFSLFDPKFLEEISQMKQKNFAVELLRKLIAEQIRIYQRTNAVRAQKFSEILANAMSNYLKGMLTNEQVIEELLKAAHAIANGEEDGKKLNLTSEELAFYDALTKPEAVEDFYTNDQLIAITRELTEALRTNKTIDWNMKESARAGMRRIIKRLLKKYNYPPEGQEMALETIMTQCEMWSENNI